MKEFIVFAIVALLTVSTGLLAFAGNASPAVMHDVAHDQGA